MLLLIAGHETTVNLIGNGMLALLQNPDQLETLKQHPELIKGAVEELLRYVNPVQVVNRYASEDWRLVERKSPRGVTCNWCWQRRIMIRRMWRTQTNSM